MAAGSAGNSREYAISLRRFGPMQDERLERALHGVAAQIHGVPRKTVMKQEIGNVKALQRQWRETCRRISAQTTATCGPK